MICGGFQSCREVYMKNSDKLDKLSIEVQPYVESYLSKTFDFFHGTLTNDEVIDENYKLKVFVGNENGNEKYIHVYYHKALDETITINEVIQDQSSSSNL